MASYQVTALSLSSQKEHSNATRDTEHKRQVEEVLSCKAAMLTSIPQYLRASAASLKTILGLAPVDQVGIPLTAKCWG